MKDDMDGIKYYIDVSKMVGELKDYIEMDGPTSMTECIEGLRQLSKYPDYLSEEMYEMLAKELRSHLLNYKNNTVVRTETEPVTRNETTTWLEWI